MWRKVGAGLMRVGLGFKGRRMLRELELESRDVKGAQQKVLARILETNRDTAFGRDFHFGAISSAEEFAGGVPIQTYEDLRPYVERAARGEEGVLFPGKPIFYATTSGTTSAPKLIPISEEYNRRCYSGLSKLWMYAMFETAPGYLDGYDLALVGKTCEGQTPDGTPYGSFSGLANADTPEFARRMRVIPSAVHDIDDYRAKYYTLMRIALQHPIKWILAVNPSSLLELHRSALEHFDEIVDDIEKGTLSGKFNINPEIRGEVEQRLRPAPKRAAELKKLRRAHDPLLPKHYWPTLKIINTWTAGNAALYLNRTAGFYPEHTIIQEFGYLATEARAGIILKGDQRASILAAHQLYFEFIRKEERWEPHPPVHLAHEVVEGGEYYIFVTTPSGLYRYDMNDIVRVEGFYNEFPMVRFIQKGAGVTSLTGEKLYESQYLEAMQKTAGEQGISCDFHIAFADIVSSSYEVFLETQNRPDLEQFATSLDEKLKSANMEYRAKRESRRLHPPKLHLLRPDSFEAFKSWRRQQGARDAQFKLMHLSDDSEQLELFRKLSVDTPFEKRATSDEKREVRIQ